MVVLLAGGGDGGRSDDQAVGLDVLVVEDQLLDLDELELAVADLERLDHEGVGEGLVDPLLDPLLEPLKNLHDPSFRGREAGAPPEQPPW